MRVPSLPLLPEADFKAGQNRTHQNHDLRTLTGFTSLNEQVRGFIHSHPQHSLGTQPGGTWRGWGQGIQHPDTSSASTFPAPHMYQGKVGVKAAPRYLGYKQSAGEGHGLPRQECHAAYSQISKGPLEHLTLPREHPILLRELEMGNGPQSKPEGLWPPPQSSWGSRALRTSSVAAHELFGCVLGWMETRQGVK